MLSTAESVCLTSYQVLEQSSQSSNRLVVFDAGVDDLNTLLAGLKSGSSFHVLDAKRDGIAQISALLREFPSVDLTLVAHGFPGGLQLGDRTLELNNLKTYQQQLSNWFVGTSSATITLLSCNVALGDAGSEFVASLSALAGASVRAVATPIGNGQWPLMAMETFEPAVLSTYSATLDLTFNTVFKDGENDDVDSLEGATSVAVSGDGTQVFVTSNIDNSLTVFDRAASTGALTVSAVFKDGVDHVDGLGGASSVTVSEDGKQVFVASFEDHALAVFDRNIETGMLTFKTTFKDGEGDTESLKGAFSVTVSGDGKQVFVASQRDDALTVFDRNADTGSLTLSAVFKDGEEGINELDGARTVAVSGDGKQVFVASQLDDSLTVFDRDAITGNLTLSTVFKDEEEDIHELEGAFSVAASEDGKQVFVTSRTDHALTVFDRDETTGELMLKTVFKDGVGDVDSLIGANFVTVSGDNKQVFVTSFVSDSLTVFDRDAETGVLTLNEFVKDGIGDVDELDGAFSVAVSENGKQVFVASENDSSLTVFDREVLPGEDPDPEDPDPVDPDPEDPTTTARLTPNSAANVLEITQLGSANTLQFQLKDALVDSISELLVYSTDANGQNRTQIASLSLLESGQLSSDYAPTFSLNSDQVTQGTFLQFELVQAGTATLANLNSLNDTQARLSFSGGSAFSVELASRTATTNLMVGDADTIDLSDQSGQLDVAFTVFREANFNNTVGLYTTDTAQGGIIDSLTQETINPGDAGYKEAAIARKLDVQLTGANGKVSQFTGELTGGSFLGAYLVADGTDAFASEVYFSHAGANTNGADHVKLLGNNTFGFEDMAGLGDADFNDIVVQFAVV